MEFQNTRNWKSKSNKRDKNNNNRLTTLHEVSEFLGENNESINISAN